MISILAATVAWFSVPWDSANGAAAEENVLRATLKNGLRVIIVRNPLAPVATLVVNYRVGSDEAPSGFPGMAHAQEHMMFRGNPGLSAQQLAAVTAAMGGDFDADTQQTVTQYFFTVPSDDLDAALHIEAIRMRGILDTEKLWDQERGAIEQEVAQDLSNPEYLFYTQLLSAMFDGTPYAHDALGTRPSFNKTTGAMLKNFYEAWYAPNNAILIVAGDVDSAKTLEKVKKLFDPIPARQLPARPEFHFEPVKSQTLHLETDQPYGMAVVAFRMPGSDSPDYAAAQILSDVLSSQRGKLYGLVPAGQALFAGFSYDSLPKAGLGYAIAGFPPGTDATNLVNKVIEILTDDTSKGVPSDLVEAAKRREIAEGQFQKNSVSGLAMAWSQAVAVEGRQSPEDDVDAIRKVTAADVDRVARENLVLDHAITAILIPQPSGKPISAKGFGGKESLRCPPTKGVKLPGWAEKAVRRLAVPTSTLSPVVTNLANGIKLIVQPVSISDTISVYGQIKNNPDLETPPGKEGVNQALAQLFSYGTKSLDRLAFQKALDDIGAIESAGTSFTLQVLTEHFDRGVQLLADNELSPALPEEALKTFQPQLAAAVAGELQSPGYLASRALDIGLYPKGDPTQREATPESVKALTIQDVKDYYQRVYRPDLTTIVVIGKVKPEQAQAVIAKYFGDWKVVGPKPETLLPPVPANASSVTEVPDASRVQDKVTLAETLGLTRTNADYYALQLGNHVLGGAFYATRLYRDLREKSGLVYYVASSFNVGQTRGLYEVRYACDPPNVAKARTIVVTNLRDMQQAPVTPRELRQAKALLLREIPLSESSVSQIAEGWLSRSLHDLPLNEPILAAHRYLKLDADAVRTAFKRWVRPDDLVQVTQGPTPK
ncbi:MAG: insulinase family protein [Candidatus Omnitrophica bacterium]|nr:insulinase family protein [Candidatus Omnitrophota bacterium]